MEEDLMDGFYEDGMFLYKGLPDDLDKLESYDAFANIVTPTLTSKQSIALLKGLYVKKFCLFFKTGLGKTLMSAAYMKALKNIDCNSKFLMFIKKNQEKETPAKIKSYTGFKGVVITAASEYTITDNMLDEYDIVYMTHDCLNSNFHMGALTEVIKRIKCVVADECHLLSNLEVANSAFMLYCINNSVEYSLGLTATPITSDVEQFARCLKVIAPSYIANFRKIGAKIKRDGLEYLDPRIQDLYCIQDRVNNNKGYAVWVEPHDYQVKAKGVHLFDITKGPGAYNQANTLINLIREFKNQKGIVYVNHKVVYDFIVPYLNEHGVRCAKINGDVTKDPKERDRLLREFREGEYDVLCTNIKEALDMQSNFVIFYEYTPHCPQVIGRAERGINPTPLSVFFIFTKDTDEYDYYIRNVFEINQDVQEIMGVDRREIVELHTKRVSRLI